MERHNKKAKTAAGVATSEAPVDSEPRVGEGPDVSAPQPRTRTGGALFGASDGGGVLPRCILACVLDGLTLTDAARFVGASSGAQTEATRHYAAATTLTVGSASELVGRASLRELPLALRMCASLRKLVVRNADARNATMWDRAARAKQAASEAQTLAALLRRNSRTLTWLHTDDPLNADVLLALRECRELVVLSAPAALPALLRDGRCPERWPHLRVTRGLDVHDTHTLGDSVGWALTHVGFHRADWAYEVLALASHPLRVLECAMDGKLGVLQALHAPPADGCAAAAEELLRRAGAEWPELAQWMLEQAEEAGEAPEAHPGVCAAQTSAAALAGQLRALHASLTSVDLGNTGGSHLAGPLDGSVELPAGVWRLRARDDVLRYFGGARGLRVLSADVYWAPAAAALERVLRSLDRPDAFAVLELASTCRGMDDAAYQLASEGVETPQRSAAAASSAASALTPALRVLALSVECADVSECVARLAAARVWPALRFLHLDAWTRVALSAADAAAALQAWPALASLGAVGELDHFADREEWLADPDAEACVARYLAHASCSADPPRRAASAACGGQLERLQLGGVDARTLADPLFHRFAPWNGSLPALTSLDLGLARASATYRWLAVARILASVPCLESLDLAFQECADDPPGPPETAAVATDSEEAAVRRATALRSLTIRESWCGAAARLLLCLPALRTLRLSFFDSSGRAEADLSRMRTRLPADTRCWWK